MTNRRTQAQRSATTQEALRTAARRLWGERGYTDVGTPEIATAAPVDLAGVEQKHILQTLTTTDGNRTEAAKKLGISVRTLRNKLKEFSA